MKEKFKYSCVPTMLASSLLIMLSTNGLSQTECEDCRAWHVRVKPTIRSAQKVGSNRESKSQDDTIRNLMKKAVIDSTRKDEIARLSENKILQAIECLLKLKGDKSDSGISGATRSDTSQIFGTSSVEVASLYYISYLYHQDWSHAGAAALVDANGQLNTDEAISLAYKAYKDWFKRVKEVGLEEARKRGMEQLAGSGISWY